MKQVTRDSALGEKAKKSPMLCPICGSSKKVIYNYGRDKDLACYDCGFEYKRLSKSEYKRMNGKFRER